MTIGDAIKLIRTARRIRQRELANRLGVSANYLSMLEAGRREPTIKFLRQIAHELDVPAGLFLMWVDAESSRLSAVQTKRVRELLVEIQAIFLQDQLTRRRKSA